jgi:valyl-tRNA synthetase
VLVDVHDRLMRLLHPFIPFITEEIWQKLPKRAGDGTTISRSTFPAAVPEWGDFDAERDVAYLQSIISTIRTVRSERSVPPSRKIAAVVDEHDPRARALLETYAPYVRQLAGLETLELRSDVAASPDTVKRVLDHTHVYVPLAGIADRSGEVEKLQKELAGLAREETSLQQKLGNAGFVARAPALVVEEARARAVQLTARRRKLEAQLSEVETGAPPSRSTPGRTTTSSAVRWPKTWAGATPRRRP